jgi:hypothetical protein
MARNPRRDTEKLSSHVPRAGARESGASSATGCVEGARAAAAADRDGPDLLGFPIEAVDELAAFAASSAAGDGNWLAPAGISTLLGLEESAPMGSARDSEGPAGSDSADEPRESALGCAEDPRRAVEAGPNVSQATVSKYMLRPRRPPSQAWRTFLKNHASDLIAFIPD